MNVEGTIKFIGDTQTFGSNGFRKRDVAVTTQEQYPQTILIEFVQDKCDLLNNFGIGQEVKIGINLRGREWVNPQGETKYFNSIQGWNIYDQNSTGGRENSAVNKYDENQEAPAGQEDEDDLPF